MKFIIQAKSVMRKQAREITHRQTAEYLLAAGIRVAKHIDEWLSFSPIKLTHQSAALFVSLKDEISTAPLATVLDNRGIMQYWPHVDPYENLKFEGAVIFDLIFVPGLAFDPSGHRLGRGKGHYDSYLSGLDRQSTRPILIGLCLDEQLFEVVPIEEHDVLMDYICTPQFGMQKTTCE